MAVIRSCNGTDCYCPLRFTSSFQNAQALQRQKGSANLRKPLATQSTNTQKFHSHHQQELTKNLKKLTTKDTEVVKPSVQPKNAQVVSDTPEHMLISSPYRDSKNIFDLALKPDVKDIDEEDVDKPQLCSEFVNGIYQYMLYMESIYPIQPNYLKNTTLKSRMRCILVDWLIQVHHRFQLLQETLYLTVAVLDRFLQVFSL